MSAMAKTVLLVPLLTFSRMSHVRKEKLKIVVIAGFIALCFGSVLMSSKTQEVLAKPVFMDRYDRDPTAKEELKKNCTICHIGRGGGERNDFGDAFEDAGYRFTPKLRAKYPDMFISPKAKSQEESDFLLNGW